MYVNNIIALEENMPTYGIDGKKVTGHVTIASPGVIKCYVQNLNTKKVSDLAFYILSNKTQQAVRLGVLNKGSESRETRWTVEEKGIRGSHLALSDIDSVAIVKEGDGMRNTDTILVGFSGSRYVLSSLLERVLPKEIVIPQSKWDVKNQELQKEVESIKEIENPKEMKAIKEAESIKEVEAPKQVESIKEVEASKEVEGIKQVEASNELEALKRIEAQKEVERIAKVEVIKELEALERLKDLKAKLEGKQAVVKDKETIELGVDKEQGAFMQEEGPVLDEHEVKRESTKNFIEVLDKIGTKDLMEVLGNPSIGAIEREKLEAIIKSLQGKEVVPAYQPTESQEVRQVISKLQVALDEEYMKHQMSDSEGMVCYEEVLYNQMGDGEEAANEREEDLGETPEEINYLEEIEKKLKDIQARLKVSDILEENMRKMRPVEKPEIKEEGIPESVAIEDIAYKIVEYKNKLVGSEAIATNKEEIGRLERIFERNKPCAAPIGAENIEWRKISLSELVSIPSLSVEWCSQPFITFSYYKYNEFILGREKEGGQYYLGVPDLYHPDREQIRESDPKIQRFLGKESATPVMGGYGYWLVKL